MNKTKLISVFIHALLSISFISCAEDTSTEPELTASAQLQLVLDNSLETLGGTGVSAAVVFQNRDTWLGTSGTSFGTIAMTSDMILGIGSITKNYIAALCLELEEEGLFSLEDSIHEWLPDYQNVNNSITIRQLLNNSSGIYNITDNTSLWDAVFTDPSKLWTLDEIISAYLLEPYASPGSDWYYSNTNYILLGKIIEEATGAAVSAELRRRFFEPLGLNGTYFEIEETIPSNVAHGWFDLSGNGSFDDVSLISGNGIYSVLWTSAAIFSTAEDLAHWSSALFQGNVLSSSSLDKMLTSYYILPGTSDVGLGMGVYLISPNNSAGVAMTGYTGRTFGYLASMFYVPEYGISVAVIINDDNALCLDAITTGLIKAALNHN
jgi:D-alanyl-D-alanine carboxypeptidase